MSSVSGFVELVYQVISLVPTFEERETGDNRLCMCRFFFIAWPNGVLFGVIRSVVMVGGTVSWFFEGFCCEFWVIDLNCSLEEVDLCFR